MVEKASNSEGKTSNKTKEKHLKKMGILPSYSVGYILLICIRLDYFQIDKNGYQNHHRKTR